MGALSKRSKGPYIKHVGEGAGGFLWGPWHILMSHEIFPKTSDGPQNIFLFSIFVILFFNLRWLQHKIPKLAIKEI